MEFHREQIDPEDLRYADGSTVRWGDVVTVAGSKGERFRVASIDPVHGMVLVRNASGGALRLPVADLERA